MDILYMGGDGIFPDDSGELMLASETRFGCGIVTELAVLFRNETVRN
jgi:hypothetical protein